MRECRFLKSWRTRTSRETLLAPGLVGERGVRGDDSRDFGLREGCEDHRCEHSLALVKVTIFWKLAENLQLILSNKGKGRVAAATVRSSERVALVLQDNPEASHDETECR
jgi:hypothetical protein